MATAFNEFMRQHQMAGNEKADGYSRAAFEGLNEQEKEEVFNMLVTELPYFVEWLFFIDANKALEVVRKEEESARGNGYVPVYLLQERLLKFSGDLSCQDRMIQDYYRYADSMKPLVVDAIGRTPASRNAVEFFKKIMFSESNSSAVARAVRALLADLNILRGTVAEEEQYNRLESELRSERAKVKLRAITRIAKYEAQLPMSD